jgi:hypothetical protein
VSDAHQASRQDVEQETAEELGNVEGHQSVAVAARPVSPAKGHAVVVEGDESAVGDGDAVGVAAEVAQHLLGAGEGRFAVDDSVFASGLAESSVRVDLGARQLAVFETRLEPVQQLGAEQPGQDAHREEEARPGRDSALAVRMEASTRDNAVDVRMEKQGLGLGVQNAGEADRGAEVLGIASHVA